MKKIEEEKMEFIFGGKDRKGYATGFMCGMATAMLFTGPFAAIAAAPAIGCAIGLMS